MTKKFHLFRNAPKNEWSRGDTAKNKTNHANVLEVVLNDLLMWNSQYFNHYSKPWIPLWFSSHWRMESKHCTGTELMKALGEEVFHSHGWILLILAYSSFHSSKVWWDKELCLGWFWNLSISTDPERTPLRKGFLPMQVSQHFKEAHAFRYITLCFQITFLWGKKKSTAIPNCCVKSTPLQENNLLLSFQNKSIIQNYYIITKNDWDKQHTFLKNTI